MRKIYLIRHGKTKGNLEKRYIGRTDESLCQEGINELKIKKNSLHNTGTLIEMTRNLPKTADGKDIIYVTPLKRTKETAQCFLDDAKLIEVEAFREMDFGQFEGKNYEELKDHPAYQRFLDSGGETAFPDGEKKADFIKRCVDGFMELVKSDPEHDLVVVAHGGTIMAVMSTIIQPHKDYFSCQVKNGEGFIIDDFGENDYRLGGLLS